MPSPNYYVIGSFYNLKTSKIDEMISNEVISTDWADEIDLTSFYNKPSAQINAYLNSMGEKRPGAHRALTKLLNIKRNDIVAVKKRDGKGNIDILAYARVVERNGEIYRWDKQLLGHMINVEYLKRGLAIKKPYNKTHTIHLIDKEAEIKDIFKDLGSTIPRGNRESNKYTRKNKGTAKKNTKTQHVSGSQSHTATQKHNKLQNAVYQYLLTKYDPQCVELMEKDDIDIKLKEINAITVFEIKPFNSAKECIREALGQLIEYSYFKCDNAGDVQTKIVVVGPNKALAAEQKYISYIKSSFGLSFDYKGFKVGRFI